MEVSINGGTPKSSMLVVFFSINQVYHPFILLDVPEGLVFFAP